MTVKFIPNRLTIPFEELDGSPEERSAGTWAGDTATRKLKCLSIHRVALERELLGYSSLGGVPLAGGDALIHLPAPFGIDRPNLIATNVVTKPFGRVRGVSGDTRFANYRHSILDVAFEVATRVLSTRYGFVALSEEIRDTTEFATMPAKGLYWGTGGGREAIAAFDAPGKISHGKEWIYTIRGAYHIPANIFGYVGKINVSEIASSYTGQTYASGTLLYASPTIASEVTFRGTVYNITLRFLHKNNGTFDSPKGWNWYPRPSKTGATIDYEPIYDDADRAKVFYVMDDFRSVFA